MEDYITQLKEDEKKKEAPFVEMPSSEPVVHHHAAPARRHNHNSGNAGVGVALILIGGLFLLMELTSFRLDNWWALFILIPVFHNFRRALRSYQRHGRLTRHGMSGITGGAILLTIAVAFLFSLNWGLIWPLFLIIGGIGAVLSSQID